MEKIIDPIEKELLEAELTKEKFVRYTNKLNNHIYVFSHEDSPNLMKEIGRLREIAFRVTGGGTGKTLDIDKFDTAQSPYKQLIVWNPNHKEIVGGYRFIEGKNFEYNKENYPLVATSRLLNFSKRFIEDYIPHTIELGRSFIQPRYQAKEHGGLFTLDNLWDGLGTLLVDYPDTKYFFGKVTMYPSYNRLGRNYILKFLDKYFHDTDDLIQPYEPLKIELSQEDFDKVFIGKTFKEDSRILMKELKNLGTHIPPLISAYMNLSDTMKIFGTAINTHFGNVEETGLLVTARDMYPHKLERHIKAYRTEKWENWLRDKIASVN